MEHPQLLALHVLRSWTTEAIDEAISSAVTQRVAVDRVAVLVAYFTAIAGPDGSVEFLEDTYRRDSRLIDALFTNNIEAVAHKRNLVADFSHEQLPD